MDLRSIYRPACPRRGMADLPLAISLARAPAAGKVVPPLNSPTTLPRAPLWSLEWSGNSVGLSAPATWSALIAGRSGVGRITRFDASLCTAQIAAEVKILTDLPAGGAVHPGDRDAAGDDGGESERREKDRPFLPFGVGRRIRSLCRFGPRCGPGVLALRARGGHLGVGLGGLPEIAATQETGGHGFRKIFLLHFGRPAEHLRGSSRSC